MLWLQQPLNLTQFNPPQKIVEHWRIIAEVHSTCSASTWGFDTWLWHLTCFFCLLSPLYIWYGIFHVTSCLHPSFFNLLCGIFHFINHVFIKWIFKIIHSSSRSQLSSCLFLELIVKWGLIKKIHNCLIQSISFYAFLTLCFLLEDWALKSSFHCFWYLDVHAYPKVPWRGLLFYGAMCNSHLNKSFTATFRFNDYSQYCSFSP